MQKTLQVHATLTQVLHPLLSSVLVLTMAVDLQNFQSFHRSLKLQDRILFAL
jgi:hypothetical protein